MAGSSPGTSGSTSGCVSGEMRGGAGEACCYPCNRGCAPLECIVKLPKSFTIDVMCNDQREYVEVEYGEDGSAESWKLSVDNLVRTISTCHEVEEVSINDWRGSFGGVAEGLKAVCEALKTVPSLKKLSMDLGFKNSDWSVSDVLLHIEALQQVDLEVISGPGVIADVIRYMRAPTNVLTSLNAYGLTDEELVELAEALGDNKQLKKLVVNRDGRGSGRGVGRIGEALRTNRVLEELTIFDTEMGGEEMEALVGALVPDPTSALQPNAHLHTLGFYGQSIENKDGMEQVATLLRTNTSLRKISLSDVDILKKGHVDVMTAAQMLFIALQSNASLLALDLYNCSGIEGIEMLGMIMDMLLHNHSLREIYLHSTGMKEDGGAEVVYAELRARQAKDVDQKMDKAVQKMEHVPPNSARVFLCGDPKAGKTTLCHRLIEIDGKKPRYKGFKRPKWLGRKKKMGEKNAEERTRGIEVHKMIWKGMKISIWDMAGQMEYHAFHDMILPNQCAKGECCFYFIICNPMKHWSGKLSSRLKDEIEYWMMFLASNTRHSKSYRPHVTILMTHRDLWPSSSIFIHHLKKIVDGLKKRYEDVLDLDQDLSFIEMENVKSSNAAQMIKDRVQEYLVHLSSKLPKVLKASEELQSIVEKWCAKHTNDHVLKWEVFSKDMCEKVEELSILKIQDGELFEKMKKHVVAILHSGGHIMYFEELDMVIMNLHWFCNDVIGNILFNCSRLTEQYDERLEYGVISQQDFLVLWEEVCEGNSFEFGYKEILKITTKLQLCYEDIHDKIMIPSLLSKKLDSMDWKVVFHESDGAYKYLGTRLTKRVDTITSLSIGFFPRLQVLLHDKYQSNSYKVYLNAISFIYEDINVMISYKDGSVDIMSRCTGERDHVNCALQKTIMRHVNDLRQTPTLGCPGVILEEHIIWPSCIVHPSKGKFQSVAKKYLKEMVLHTGNLWYAHHGEDENGLDQAWPAKVLLGDEEWQMILQSREEMVMKMDKEISGKLNGVCGSNNEIQSLDLIGTLEGESVDEVCSANETPYEVQLEKVMQRNHNSMKKLIQCNHKEVMDKLQEMETKIIHSQETLAARVCANIDHLMKCTLQMKNSKIPKLPYITKSDGKGGIRTMLLKMVPGLATYNLQFRCEHNDHGLHMIDDQPGCEIHIGDDKTRTFGTVMYWGLTISTMLVKVGAHVVAGAGSMVPNWCQEFATLLDTAGLLDLVQPRGVVLEYLPIELKKNQFISLEDNKVAIDWLVMLLGEKCKSKSMFEMFKLTEVKYTSKSSKRSEIGWVCDKHNY